MDQGIIQNLKTLYRRHLLRRRLAAIDNNVDYDLHLLNALNFLHRSWKEVKPETLKNCFRKAGFYESLEVCFILHFPFMFDVQSSDDIIDVTDENDDDSLWQDLQHRNDIDDDLNIDDYLTVDNELATNGVLTLEEIADACREKLDDDEDTEDETLDIELLPPPPVTRQAAYQSFATLQKYVEENGNDQKMVELCNVFDDFLYVERHRNAVQTTLDRFLA